MSPIIYKSNFHLAAPQSLNESSLKSPLISSSNHSPKQRHLLGLYKKLHRGFCPNGLITTYFQTLFLKESSFCYFTLTLNVAWLVVSTGLPSPVPACVKSSVCTTAFNTMASIMQGLPGCSESTLPVRLLATGHKALSIHWHRIRHTRQSQILIYFKEQEKMQGSEPNTHKHK